MNEGQKQAARDFVDWFWKTVVVLTEFKTAAGASNSLAVQHYQENAAYGHAPTFPGLAWFRAKFLYAYMPFDRSINGKVKNPIYLILAAISFIPFGCIRLVFFFLLLLLHLAGAPPDTYQIINFVFTMKGTEFKSGGVILFAYAIFMYLRCATPGDPDACEADGPGASISKLMSVLDILGSVLLSWVAFFAIPGTKVHQGQDGYQALMPRMDEIEDMMRSAGFEVQEKSSDEIHRCFPACLRLPPCVASVRSINRWLERWPPGAHRVFVLLIYDLLMLGISLGYLWWLISFDVASAQAEMGVPLQAIQYDWRAVRTWWSSPEANISLFHARVCYHMLALPFVIFMAPGLSTIIGLAPRTGYNQKGYCVPHTLRPVAKPAARWSCQLPRGPSPTAASAAPSGSPGPSTADKAGGRGACAPPRQCGF
eukprot:SRR837773.7658.p1 GENE.SRR837773.7658~~SRR837773.7658.p1  ORF type:complete len:449 (-),score=52.73 SRR837773.7658:193-1467(-)